MNDNYRIALVMIRESLGLPPHATCSAVVACVRALIAAAAAREEETTDKPAEP